MISKNVKQIVESPSNGVIRKMFEEGALLKQKFGAENVYDFSIGNPDLDPPQKVCDAVKEVALDTTHLRHGYMPNPGYTETRQAMAKKTSIEQGVEIDFSNVVMSVGAAGAINATLKALLNPNDEVIVPCPYFAEYGHYVHNYNGKIVGVPTKSDFSLDSDAIKSALTEKTAAVLINSPNNPCGAVYSEETVKKLEKTLTDNKAIITLSKELGQKEFAYEIKKMKSGYYYLYNIETNSIEATKEFDRVARIDENIVRHLILKIGD